MNKPCVASVTSMVVSQTVGTEVADDGPRRTGYRTLGGASYAVTFFGTQWYTVGYCDVRFGANNQPPVPLVRCMVHTCHDELAPRGVKNLSKPARFLPSSSAVTDINLLGLWTTMKASSSSQSLPLSIFMRHDELSPRCLFSPMDFHDYCHCV